MKDMALLLLEKKKTKTQYVTHMITLANKAGCKTAII